jgi:hypothetical protein
MSFPYVAANLPWYLDPVFLPAATGLFGVIIGGLITAGATYLLDIRRESRELEKAELDRASELRKAARLLLSDLDLGVAAIKQTLSGRKYYRLPHDPLAETSWATYRAVFASVLSFGDWSDVSMGTLNLSHFKAVRDQAVTSGSVDVNPEVENGLRLLLSEIEAAEKALGRIVE